MATFTPPSWWLAGTNQNSIPANDNALRFWISQTDVNNATTAQPGSPSDGDAYIIQSTHTGAVWSTFTPDDLVIFNGGTWYAFTPEEGNRVTVGGAIYVYTSGTWTAASGGGGGAVAGSDKQIQFNDGGSFGAEAGFEYDKTANTLTVDKAYTAASTTGGAGLRLPHGSAPTSPTNGDVWTTTAGIYVRINGVTVGPLGSGGGVARSTVSALAGSGSIPIDYALGDYFTLGLTGNVTTFTFSNLPGSGNGASLMVRITQDSTPRTVSWPASFKWAGGVAPSFSTGSGAVDVLAITTFDNGTTWNATLAKTFS